MGRTNVHQVPHLLSWQISKIQSTKNLHCFFFSVVAAIATFIVMPFISFYLKMHDAAIGILASCSKIISLLAMSMAWNGKITTASSLMLPKCFHRLGSVCWQCQWFLVSIRGHRHPLHALQMCLQIRAGENIFSTGQPGGCRASLCCTSLHFCLHSHFGDLDR